MGAAIKDIRREVKKSIDLADDKTVKMIYAMLEVEQKEDAWTDAAFLAEMEARAKEYESGSAKLFTLEEMENNARRSYKARKK
ncbi:MAG: hypothetical protein K0Q79_1975 [Flavipsychrobacter sp.]|jgi:hypothetical protein|nr:hypothetical protein [Flavipsychrobacter sp.]